MSENKIKEKYKILKKEEKNKIASLEIEIPFSEVFKHQNNALKKLGENLEIKGFRKGAAPEKIIRENIEPLKILEEMAYRAVIEILPIIISEEKIETLTQPKIAITKIAENNPLTFKADFILMPDIKIADYKEIAKSIPAVEKIKLEEKEIEDYVEYLLKTKNEAEYLKKKTSSNTEEREGAEKNKNDFLKLDDNFVKTLGDFKNVEDFKNQLRENMQKEKETAAKQKRRLEIIEKIITESEINLPEILIEEELHQMMNQFENDLKNIKMNLDDYLKEIKKTKEDLFKDWKPDAIKRSKMNLILPKIALLEKIETDSEKVLSEVKHLKEHYPEIDEKQAEMYVTHILRNEEVFNFLEKIN